MGRCIRQLPRPATLQEGPQVSTTTWCGKPIALVDLYPPMPGRPDVYLDPDGAIPKEPRDGHRFAGPGGSTAPHPDLLTATVEGGVCRDCAAKVMEALTR